jgi:probable rRNA maturation factor
MMNSIANSPEVTNNPVVMDLEVEIQNATALSRLPAEADFRRWVAAALQQPKQPIEVVIRLVDKPESRRLNHSYRGKDQPTNILSFPFEAPPQVATPLLGDLVICAPLVVDEARHQGKTELAHWAHLVVHGVLHLQGYDHQGDAQAEQMEGLERSILQRLHFPDPYNQEDP